MGLPEFKGRPCPRCRGGQVKMSPPCFRCGGTAYVRDGIRRVDVLNYIDEVLAAKVAAEEPKR